MTIKCPSCGGECESDIELEIGRKVRCPFCEHSFFFGISRLKATAEDKPKTEETSNSVPEQSAKVEEPYSKVVESASVSPTHDEPKQSIAAEYESAGKSVGKIVLGIVGSILGGMLTVMSTCRDYMRMRNAEYLKEFGVSSPSDAQWVMFVLGVVIGIVGAVVIYKTLMAVASRVKPIFPEKSAAGRVLGVVCCVVVVGLYHVALTAVESRASIWDYLIMMALCRILWRLFVGGRRMTAQKGLAGHSWFLVRDRREEVAADAEGELSKHGELDLKGFRSYRENRKKIDKALSRLPNELRPNASPQGDDDKLVIAIFLVLAFAILIAVYCLVVLD